MLYALFMYMSNKNNGVFLFTVFMRNQMIIHILKTKPLSNSTVSVFFCFLLLSLRTKLFIFMMHWKINTCWDCKQVTNEINPLSTLLCYVFLTILKCVHLHSVLINLRLHVSSNCKKMLYQNYTQTLIQYGQMLFHVLQIVLKEVFFAQ